MARRVSRSASFAAVEASLPFADEVVDIRQYILRLDSRTMAEIRRYNRPPTVVHEVMISALLLLGDPESVTRDWKKCQALCKTAGSLARGLKSRVVSFNIHTIHPEIAARAKQILQKYNPKDVKAVSSGLGAFYDWAMAAITEVESTDDFDTSAKPADSKRQVQIFQRQHRDDKQQLQQRRNSLI